MMGLMMSVVCSAASARERADQSPQKGSLVAMSSKTLLSTSTPRQARRRACKLRMASVTYVAWQRVFRRVSAPGSRPCSCGRAPGLANEGVIPGHLELDFRMRQKAQPVPNLPRDGDLPLGSDLHGDTLTGKCSPVAIPFAIAPHRRHPGYFTATGPGHSSITRLSVCPEILLAATWRDSSTLLGERWHPLPAGAVDFMATSSLVSVDQYLTTSYRPDCDYVDGVLLERNAGEFDHGRLQTAIAAFYYNHRKQWGVHASTEQRVQVAPARFRIPDVCVSAEAEPEQILD